MSTQHTTGPDAPQRASRSLSDRVYREGRRPLAVLAAGLLLLTPSCGESRRTDDPGVNVGLESMLGENHGQKGDDRAMIAGEDSAAQREAPQTDLESLLAQQAADLARAFDTPDDFDPREQLQTEPPPEPIAATTPDAADVSLAQLLAESADEQPEPSTVSPSQEAADDQAEPMSIPEPLDITALYAQLDEALGQELDATSEPFRTAVAMIALAAAQGRDPAEMLETDSLLTSTLSPEEQESAKAIAMLLGSLLLPGESATDERTSLLREFSEQLSRNLGLTIPRALLCTRVRGFGKYETFSTTSFLAGRPVRALVYVEVDGFEHGRVDTSRLGGLPIEEEWSVELSQTLELYHDAEKSILAWKKPEEMVVETSRNKQRDFYLLTEIELPRTLTIGAYQLKVIVRDMVGGRRAEALIPIKIVADPKLAWTPE